MVSLWYIFLAAAIIVMLLRKDLIKEMFWAGIFSLPILLIKPIVSENFLAVASNNGSVFYFLFIRSVFAFSFGALASAVYELFFHKKITPKKHPLRKKFLWLFLGPFLFLIIKFLLLQPFIVALIFGLLLDILIIISIRKDLIWDLVFSGFAMGILYSAVFLITYRGEPGDLSLFWFSDFLSGITLFSLPIEELLAVMLFGAFWGPIYVAFKDMKEK